MTHFLRYGGCVIKRNIHYNYHQHKTSMSYKHIFFDLDDTLWDFHANAKNSLKVTFNKLGVNRYFDDFEDFFRIYMERNNELWDLYGAGKITKDFLQAERFRHPLKHVGANNEALAQEMGKTYLDLLPERTILMPHAKELLDYLHEKYTLTIITNGFVGVQHKKIKNSQIEHYFKHIVLSEDAGALKPDKRIFEYALQLNHASAEEAIMIGDIFQADIVGAQNAGIDQIFFNWRKKQLNENEHATYIISSLSEVFDIL